GNCTSVLCLPFPQRRRIPLAGASRDSLWDRGNLYADAPAFGRTLSDPTPGSVSSRRGNLGNRSLLPYPPGSPRRVGSVRRYRYADSWDFHLGAVAIELGLRDWNFDRNQLDLQRDLKVHAFSGCSRCNSSVSVIHGWPRFCFSGRGDEIIDLAKVNFFR